MGIFSDIGNAIARRLNHNTDDNLTEQQAVGKISAYLQSAGIFTPPGDPQSRGSPGKLLLICGAQPYFTQDGIYPPPIADLLAQPDNPLKAVMLDPIAEKLGKAIVIDVDAIAERLELGQYEDNNPWISVRYLFTEANSGSDDLDAEMQRTVNESCAVVALGLLQQGHNVAFKTSYDDCHRIPTNIDQEKKHTLGSLLAESPGPVEVLAVISNNGLTRGLKLEDTYSILVPNFERVVDQQKITRVLSSNGHDDCISKVVHPQLTRGIQYLNGAKDLPPVTVTNQFGHQDEAATVKLTTALQNFKKMDVSGTATDWTTNWTNHHKPIFDALSDLQEAPLPNNIVNALQDAGKGLLYGALSGKLQAQLGQGSQEQEERSLQSIDSILKQSRPNAAKSIFEPTTGVAGLASMRNSAAVADSTHHVALAAKGDTENVLIVAKKDLKALNIPVPSIGQPLKLPREQGQEQQQTRGQGPSR